MRNPGLLGVKLAPKKKKSNILGVKLAPKKKKSGTLGVRPAPKNKKSQILGVRLTAPLLHTSSCIPTSNIFPSTHSLSQYAIVTSSWVRSVNSGCRTAVWIVPPL